MLFNTGTLTTSDWLKRSSLYCGEYGFELPHRLSLCEESTRRYLEEVLHQKTTECRVCPSELLETIWTRVSCRLLHSSSFVYRRQADGRPYYKQCFWSICTTREGHELPDDNKITEAFASFHQLDDEIDLPERWVRITQSNVCLT